MTELFANNATSTLNGTITNVATTLIVASATTFPSGGNFRILVDSEIMLVTGVSTNTFTVTRGIESTSAAAHTTGVPVTHIITAGALTQLKLDTIAASVQTGTAANRPAATGSGLIYFYEDYPIIAVDDPTTTAWKLYSLSTGHTPTPTLAATYTIVSNSSNPVGLYLVQEGDAVRAVSMKALATCALLTPTPSLAASATWIVTLAARFLTLFNAQYPEMGPVVTNGTATSSTGYAFTQWWNGGIPGLHNLSITVGTTTRVLGNETGGEYTLGASGILWLRLLNDGTSLHFQGSVDGNYWFEWTTTIASPSGLTNYGFFLGNGGGFTSGTAAALILQNTATTLNVAQASLNAASNASPIVVGTIAAHNLQSGDYVRVQSAGGANTNANTSAFVHVLTTTTFELLGTTGNGAYTSGGTVTCLSR